MSNQVVPFGKYKGQPVEAMAEDSQYLQWLLSQPWLQDKYPQINTIIINNFAEPNETPEHNALQALFFDDKYAVAACYAAIGHNALVSNNAISESTDFIGFRDGVRLSKSWMFRDSFGRMIQKK